MPNGHRILSVPVIRTTHVDSGNLGSLDSKRAHIRDAVVDVVRGRATGLYLFGRGGTGKTYGVLEALKEFQASHYYHRGALTPQGFFEVLLDNDTNHSNKHIVADNCYDVIADKRSREYALAALDDTNDNGIRQVDYRRQGDHQVARVGRGLIMISNLPLSQHSNAVLAAFEDRVLVIEHDPTDGEILALCRVIAHTPNSGLTVKEQVEVLDYMVELCSNHGVRPSLRLYCKKSLPIYIGWKKGESRHHWKDRLKAVVLKRSVPATHAPTLGERQDYLLMMAQKCWDEGTTLPERRALWETRTGTHWHTGYRYWRQLRLVR